LDNLLAGLKICFSAFVTIPIEEYQKVIVVTYAVLPAGKHVFSRLAARLDIMGSADLFQIGKAHTGITPSTIEKTTCLLPYFRSMARVPEKASNT
jgi:hypothetical protein